MINRLDIIHSNMIQRCFNPNNVFYQRYGGRGITVCDEWRKRKPFREWAMSNGYAEGLTIDRIDNDKGYFPDNCRWVTMSENCNNRSSCHFVTAFGETHSLKEWSELLDISYNTLKYRVIHLKLSGEELLKPPVKKGGWCKRGKTNYKEL